MDPSRGRATLRGSSVAGAAGVIVLGVVLPVLLQVAGNPVFDLLVPNARIRDVPPLLESDGAEAG